MIVFALAIEPCVETQPRHVLKSRVLFKKAVQSADAAELDPPSAVPMSALAPREVAGPVFLDGELGHPLMNSATQSKLAVANIPRDKPVSPVNPNIYFPNSDQNSQQIEEVIRANLPSC